MLDFYQQHVDEALRVLKANQSRGLAQMDVEQRLHELGPNRLPRTTRPTWLRIFLNQWKSPLILILLVAGVVSGVLHEYPDMIVILFTAWLNAVIGFVQENKANHALERLRAMVQFRAVVLRDGARQTVDSAELVPGDILFLEAGDTVQADGRVIEEIHCSINESSLTGESLPVKKTSQALERATTLSDRINMIYRSTNVVSGRATVVVTATGINTEIGKIAAMVEETEEGNTPLQEQLSRLSQKIALVVGLIVVGIFLLGIFSPFGNYRLLELFQIAVAVAVAAIPEGLAISLTVILAFGMEQILKRNALVRKLVAAETLGSISVIGMDKTGTLTEGVMQVTEIITEREHFSSATLPLLAAENYAEHEAVMNALRIASLCNDAVLDRSSRRDGLSYIGDATDIALIEAAAKAGLHKDALAQVLVRKAEVPFDSRRKYMATLHHLNDKAYVYIKGAPEVILSRSRYIEHNGTREELIPSKRARWDMKETSLTSQGLRVLAVGYKQISNKQTTLHERDLTNFIYVGLIAMSDPLRPDAQKVIVEAQKAGIRVLMITGDHARTAIAIGKALGLFSGVGSVLSGQEISVLSDSALESVVKKVSIYARVDPKDKIRIIQALGRQNEVVAMIGDGVNDAPALKAADVGIALGSGTDVAREISDLVLIDNRLTTIISAISGGREIYQNIRKVVLYLLSGSLSEVVLIGGSLITGLPLAILPAQILWVNLIEDSLPTMALAFDKSEEKIMRERPHDKNFPLLDHEMKVMIATISIVSNLALFGIFLYYYFTTENLEITRSVMFAALGLDSLLYIYSVRSWPRRIWQTNPFNNHYLTGAVLLGCGLLIAGVYVPGLQTLLHTVSLGLKEWGIVVGFGVVNILVIEIVKGVFLFRRKR